MPIGTTTTATILLTGAKAGTMAALIAAMGTDMELLMVLLVGLVGGMIFSFKEMVHLEIKTTKLKALSELLFTIPVAISTAGIVYYFGIQIVNTYIPLGNTIWIFLALLSSLHYKSVIQFFTQKIGKYIDKKIENISNKGGKK